VTAAADAVRKLAPDHEPPDLALVLGSGLGPVADAVADPVVIPYDQLPGFPVGSVAGHAGRLVLGRLGGTPVAVFQGRAHLYEGIPAPQLAVPTRTARALGADLLVVTNAAGSLRAEIGPGRLMAITDHINLTGANPLIGANDDALGPRFVPMGTAYDRDLTARLRHAAEGEDVDIADGVYLAVAGPSFETPAEIRAFRTLGADAVGMSTVPEVIAAVHLGMRVAAVSAITNLAEGLGDEPLSHEQTLASAKSAADDLQRVLLRFCQELPIR
jgi:xanthosine phosphorylase